MNPKAEGISIVVPFLNEEEGILLFCETMDHYAEGLSFPLELIFVDDGSTDATVQRLQEYSFRHIPRVQLLRLSKNYGSHAAIRAGLTHASFGVCTWLGSDLQEPLELLPASWEKIRNGCDVVYVEKKTIQVSRANRAFSRIYSWLVRKYAVPAYSSGGISTIVFNQKIRDYLNENIESNSSIMLQILDAGFQSATLSLDFHERSAGVSKWTLKKKIKLFIDSFVAFSFAPIRLVSLVGIFLFLIGILTGLFVLINKLVNPAVPAGYSTLVSILAMGFGVTNISLGLIAEYLWRAYDAARRRPSFLISEAVHLKGDAVE